MLNLNKISTFYQNFVPVKTLHDVICWQDDEKGITKNKENRQNDACHAKK